MERHRGRAERWTWRLPMPMPWGQALDHPVRPLELLGFPLAFTQNDLLSPDDFVKRASERGVQIRPEHLLELHRRRALVPLLRVAQRPPRSPVAIPVAASAADGYHQYRSPLALVIEAANYGCLTDPGIAPFRRWDGGLPLPVHGRIHRYPSVFYSSYQLLALGSVRALTRTMTATRAADGHVTCRLDPLTRDEAAALDGCRQLAIMLTALDMHYLPGILLTIHQARVWEKEDPGFDVAHRLGLFGVTPEALAVTAEQLLMQASVGDPLGPWYDLIRQARSGTPGWRSS